MKRIENQIIDQEMNIDARGIRNESSDDDYYILDVE